MPVSRVKAHTSDRAQPTREWSRAGWAVRGGYFWYFAAIGAFTPFATLIYHGLGFSGIQIGVLAALPAVAVALVAPVIGSVADARSAHQLLLWGALLIAALAALGLTQVSTFALVAAFVGLLAIGQAPIGPLFDGYAVTTAERLRVSYGNLRVWGSIGYILVSLAIGRLMGDQVTRLPILGYAVCLGLGFVAALNLPRLGDRTGRTLLGGLQLLRDPRLALILLVAFLTWANAGILYAFLGIHIQEIGGSANLVGIAFALGAVTELPIVGFSGWLIHRLGATWLIALAILAYAIRFAAFSLITTPEWILAAQTLHGLAFGGFLVATVTLTHRLAGPDHAAGAQSLLTAVSFGAGIITGSLIGGALLDRIGTTGLFQGATVTTVATLVVFLIGARVYLRAPSV